MTVQKSSSVQTHLSTFLYVFLLVRRVCVCVCVCVCLPIISMPCMFVNTNCDALSVPSSRGRALSTFNQIKQAQ